ncbi:MAG: helix-turn-helix domain-containing protein [Alphaproteobacteria bacterium]|nr:helix-turn-helix domain-containing protein [Alphaproteobacteria bacterium]
MAAAKPSQAGNRGARTPVDAHVGRRIRQRRHYLGMTQSDLGDGVGLAFQQIQKYEQGINRVTASRLLDIATVLGVPIGFFFEGIASPVAPQAEPSGQTGGETDPMTRRETIDLVKAYYDIEDGLVRKRLFDLAKSLADWQRGNTGQGEGEGEGEGGKGETGPLDG